MCGEMTLLYEQVSPGAESHDTPIPPVDLACKLSAAFITLAPIALLELLEQSHRLHLQNDRLLNLHWFSNGKER